MKATCRRLSVPVLLFSCLGALAGCVPGAAVEAGRAEAVDNVVLQADYFAGLRDEYRSLAEYERSEHGHEGDASFFEKKARDAERNIPVPPEDPARHDIPGFAREDVEAAHGQLSAALETMFSPENGPLLAVAQTRYDCWLVHREDFPQKNAHLACRRGFYEAMSLLKVPDGRRYEIYFDSGSASLDGEGMETVRAAAARFGDREGWKVVLAGYTDSRGGKSGNKTLSLRRAMAARNALAQQGVPLDSIVLKAGGADSAAPDEAEGRRVEIAIEPAGPDIEPSAGEQAPGWEHSGAEGADY